MYGKLFGIPGSFGCSVRHTHRQRSRSLHFSPSLPLLPSHTDAETGMKTRTENRKQKDILLFHCTFFFASFPFFLRASRTFFLIFSRWLIDTRLLVSGYATAQPPLVSNSPCQ